MTAQNKNFINFIKKFQKFQIFLNNTKYSEIINQGIKLGLETAETTVLAEKVYKLNQ